MITFYTAIFDVLNCNCDRDISMWLNGFQKNEIARGAYNYKIEGYVAAGHDVVITVSVFVADLSEVI